MAGCATAPRTRSIAACVVTSKPKTDSSSIAWHLIDTTLLSCARAFSPVRAARKLVGRPAGACDLVNDAVPDSSFFTNRQIGRLSADEIRRGPTKPGQEAQAPFTITRLKGEGKTAGFFVTDAKGDHYLLKLDVAGYPELVTGAEVVVSKLLYALGYFVPSYEIISFTRKQLSLDPKAERSPELVDKLLAARIKNGRIRASASRMIDGDIVGHIAFKGYACCAELRALRLAYAWLNNTDAKDHNSLLVWEHGRGVGYLIDFGTSLGGEAEHGPKKPCQGWEYDVDLGDWTREILTLGLYSNGCKRDERPSSPALGRFSARFDPRRWKPYAPNLAFDDMTRADARWMAARIMQLSQKQLKAAIAAGQYSDPEDERRLLEVLEARRRAIAQAYAPELLSHAKPAGSSAIDRQPPDWLVP